MPPKDVSFDQAVGRVVRGLWQKLSKSPALVAVAFFMLGGGSGTTLLPAVQKGLNIGSAAKMDSVIVLLHGVSEKTHETDETIRNLDERFASHVEESKDEHAEMRRLLRYGFRVRPDNTRTR